MYQRFFRLVGKILASIGVILLLFPIVVGLFWFAYMNDPYNPPYMYIPPEGIFTMIGIFSVGFILTSAGMVVLRRYRKVRPFFIKGGGPIHSADAWKKGSESGLFLTSCGFVLSINEESNATAHIGYRIINAERATCRDCALAEGSGILERASHGRSEH